ncbi:hypothetical protein NMG60_11030578 [Bertholletia excelsa]
MADVKRWSVTFTKHIKQKRKVYQDGFLELHNSSHKIMLYDDGEKVMESRVVKKDDVVRSGETLAFDAYLVDIGDLDGQHEVKDDTNFQGRDKKISEKAGFFHEQKFEDHSVCINDRKPYPGKTKVQSSSISPSQKFIREFKKNELNKYGVKRSSPVTTETNYSEWQVLYTMQLTQKAKKYHDGILRVGTSGSQGRQVTLYDISRRVLDSRFLKKDEKIESGESLALDGHLVDIGEPDGDQKPKTNLNVQGRISFASSITADKGNSGSSKTVSPKHCPKAVKTSTREWWVLYTAQVTQKAKKYHDGILRLVPCGTHQMQATLLNEDGTLLSQKYLKLSEDVNIGSMFELPNYLVEVGDPRTSPEGEAPKDGSSEKHIGSRSSGFGINNYKLGRRVPIHEPLCNGEASKDGSSERGMDSNSSGFHIDNFKSGMRAPIDKPLRNVNEILSILRKSKSEEGSVPINELCRSSQSSDFTHFELPYQPKSHTVPDSNYGGGDHDDYDKETSKKCTPVALHDNLPNEILQSSDFESRGEQHKPFTPSSSSLGTGTPDVSISVPDAECTDKSILRPVSSIVFKAVKLEPPDNFQPPEASLSDDELNRTEPRCHDDLLYEEVKIGISPEATEESKQIPGRGHGGAICPGVVGSNCHVSRKMTDIRMQSSDVYKSTDKMDEIPSFDLGF